MAWRDDCTKHKPKTGGMSTKFGEAKKSSLSPTKRSRINPKRPGPQEARDKDSSDIRRFGGGVDQTFADQPPHPPGCAPRGHGTGIPAILDDLMEATPVSSPKKTLNHNEIFVKFFTNFHQLQPASHQLSGQQRSTEELSVGSSVPQCSKRFEMMIDTTEPGRWRRKEEILPYTMPLKISLDTMPPEILPCTMPPKILPETMPPDILPEAPAPPRGEKRGDGDPAPPRGEKRGDGDRYAPARDRAVGGDGGHYAAVPNVDPGGQQRPEVIGTLCGRGGFEDPSRSRVRIPDRRRHFLIHTSQWTFPTCLRGPKEELPIKPRPLQEVHQRKTLVMGPVFPNENRNLNKWETQRNSLRSSFVFQFVKTMLFILTILGGVECIRNSHISCEVA